MLVSALFLLEAILVACCAVRVWLAGSAEKRPILTAYLLASVFMTTGAVVVLGLSQDVAWLKRVYSQLWQVTRPVFWILHALVVTELFTELLKPYRGLQRFGQRFLRWSMAVGCGIGLVAYAIPSSADWLITTWGRHESVAYASLAVVCSAMFVFRRMFRLAPCRNWWSTSSCFQLYFAGGAVLSLLTVLYGRDFVAVRDVAGLVVANCAFGWIAVRFSRQGEETNQPAPAMAWSDVTPVQALEALNDLLEEIQRRDGRK